MTTLAALGPALVDVLGTKSLLASRLGLEAKGHRHRAEMLAASATN